MDGFLIAQRAMFARGNNKEPRKRLGIECNKYMPGRLLLCSECGNN